MTPAAIGPVDGEPVLGDLVIELPTNPRAGALKVNRAQAIERTARLLAADPGMGIDRAWYHVAGFELGRWRRELGLEVMDRLAAILFVELVPNL